MLKIVGFRYWITIVLLAGFWGMLGSVGMSLSVYKRV